MSPAMLSRSHTTPLAVTGLILAGGQSRRMGGQDKALLPWHNQPLIAQVLQRLQPQVSTVLISANRHHDRYAQYGTVVSDPSDLPVSAGPLLGVAAGLRVCQTEWLLCVPCDSPLLPLHLGHDLAQAALHSQVPVATAWAQGRRQGVFLLLHQRLGPALEQWLRDGGRKVDTWLDDQGAVKVVFNDDAAFANLNTPEDWQAITHYDNQSENR